MRARVYTATEVDGPPALLVPGVHAGGIDEPRLVQFARDVASMGRTVVTAELPDLKRYSITPRTTDMIEDAALWLSTTQRLAPDGRIGMMGISFAGGLSIVAAGRPSLRDRVAFVMSFGGHGDLPRTLRYLCTGVQPDGERASAARLRRRDHPAGRRRSRGPRRPGAGRCATPSWRSCTPRTSTWWTSRRRRSNSRARKPWRTRSRNRRRR